MNTGYLRYLRSPEWHAKRLLVLQRDGYRCQVWLEHPGEEVHHRTYAHLGDEPLDDLITLCRSCHKAITTIVRRERFRQRRPRIADHQRQLPVTEIERLARLPLVADTLRHVPLPAERITRHGVSLPAVSNYRRRTPDLSQRADPRPAE